MGLPSGLSLSFRFPQQNPVYASPVHHMRYVPADLIPLNLITQTIFGEQYITLSSCGFLHPPITASILGSKTIQPIQYWIVSHWQMPRNFKSNYFYLQLFTTFGSDIGSASILPYLDLQVLLPNRNLFSARPFRCYTLPSLNTHWTLPSLPQAIKHWLSDVLMRPWQPPFLGGGLCPSSKLNNGVSEVGSVSD